MNDDVKAGGGAPARRSAGDLRVVGALAAELAGAGSAAEGRRLLAERLLAMTGALAVSVTRFDAQAGVLRIGHLAAAPGVLETVRRVLGQPAGSLDLRPGGNFREILAGPRVVELSGLREVFFGQVPEQLAADLEHAVGVGRIYGLALRHAGEVLGAAVIFLPRGGPSPAAEVLEALAESAAAALWSKRAEAGP